MYYPDEVIEQVRQANDIVDVIGEYVKLTKKGSKYFGLCPFHNEKTASFSVSPDMQLYYCFGCGAGGNVYTFVMEYESFSFQEAIEHLAKRAGITLPKVSESRSSKEQESLQKQLLDIHKKAARYYYYQLKSERGAKALSYLNDRGLSEETITGFGLGYSNSYSDDLYQYLKKEGFQDEVLAKSGLVKISEKGVYDLFWNRVMFPIMDVQNRVIGFGARVMGKGEPKYLNSPETGIFDKSRNLYGLNVARRSRKSYFLVCEGYMDVISLHQAGFSNAIASLGTAFTSQHASLIKRYAKQVILTYDSDNAGVKAALRAIPILKQAGISTKVLDMRPYKDPDEFIQALGAEAFEERIEQAQNSFLYEIAVLYRQYDSKDPEQKTAFQHEVVRKLLEFTDEMERNNYIEAVATAYHIPYDMLKKQVNTLGGQIGYQAPVPEEPERMRKKKEGKESGSKKAQKLLLSCIVAIPQCYGAICSYIQPKDYTYPLYQTIAQLIYSQMEEKGKLEPADIVNHFIDKEEEQNQVSQIFHLAPEGVETQQEKERLLTDLVYKVKKDNLDAAGRSVTDMESLQDILKQQSALKNLYISLN
jgi:DNA primase